MQECEHSALSRSLTLCLSPCLCGCVRAHTSADNEDAVYWRCLCCTATSSSPVSAAPTVHAARRICCASQRLHHFCSHMICIQSICGLEELLCSHSLSRIKECVGRVEAKLESECITYGLFRHFYVSVFWWKGFFSEFLSCFRFFAVLLCSSNCDLTRGCPNLLFFPRASLDRELKQLCRMLSRATAILLKVVLERHVPNMLSASSRLNHLCTWEKKTSGDLVFICIAFISCAENQKRLTWKSAAILDEPERSKRPASRDCSVNLSRAVGDLKWSLKF